MTKPSAPPNPEFDAFKELAEKLVQVPAKEIQQQRADDSRGKPKSKPKKARKKANG